MRWVIVAAGAAALMAGAALAQEPMKPSGLREFLLSNDDQAFFRHAASAGLFEVKSAELADAKTGDPRIKAFARAMLADHTSANHALTALAQKKKVALDTALSGREQRQLARLEADPPGKQFDDDFRRASVSSHRKAVALFDNAAKNSKDPEVRALASQTLSLIEHDGGMAQALKS